MSCPYHPLDLIIPLARGVEQDCSSLNNLLQPPTVSGPNILLGIVLKQLQIKYSYKQKDRSQFKRRFGETFIAF
jgi:hypothetical protein